MEAKIPPKKIRTQPNTNSSSGGGNNDNQNTPNCAFIAAEKTVYQTCVKLLCFGIHSATNGDDHTSRFTFGKGVLVK